MAIKILNKNEKAEIEKKLHGQFGINEIKDKIISIGKEKLFLFSGDFSEKEIKHLERIVKIERVGAYFAKIDEKTKDIRLSIEGSHILKSQITKNIFSLDSTQTEEWMKGHELLIKTGKRDFLIMKHGEDFLGSGKASEEKIGNFIPKNRRLKEKGFKN